MQTRKNYGLTRRQKIWIAAVVAANILLLLLLGISTFQVAEKANSGQDYVTTIAPSSPGLKGDTGPAGPPPTPQQVAQAVYNYCASTGICEGKTPSMSVVFAAVSQFCADGNCKGETGAAGAEGAAGADAAEVTEASIQSAVVNYCANGKCVGPTGPMGPAGESITGEPGVDGVDGQPPVSWKFTYLTTEYTCQRDDPFDSANPTYSCTPTRANGIQ